MYNIESPSFIEGINLPPPFELTEFSAGALRAFQKYLFCIHDIGAPFACVNINSYGGDTGVMSGFISLMESYRDKGIKFIGVVTGFALSAGASVFLFCDQRYIGVNGILMIHDSQISVGDTRVAGVKNFADFVTIQDKSANEQISLHLKKRKGWLSAELDKHKGSDWFLNATQAKDLGLAEIGIPNFNVRISAQFEITY